MNTYIGLIGVMVVMLLTGCGRETSPMETLTASGTVSSGIISSGVIDLGTVRERRIYALGDSLTAGYQLPVDQSYPSQLEKILQARGYTVRVINGGKSGDTSAGLRDRLAWTTADAQSGDIAILVIGANDGLQGLSVEQMLGHMDAIIHDLQKRGLTVVLGGMQLPTNYGETYRRDFGGVYEYLAQTYDTRLIPFFLSGVAMDPTLNLQDRIHPNASGYAIIAQTVADVIMQ